jgi:hypothetical protein
MNSPATPFVWQILNAGFCSATDVMPSAGGQNILHDRLEAEVLPYFDGLILP